MSRPKGCASIEIGTTRRAHATRAARCALVIGAAMGGLALSGCAPVAVVGAAIVVNEEFADNAQVAIVKDDVAFVWASVKSTMTHMTTDLLQVDEDAQAVRTYVENSQVTVQVERYDVGETRIRTAAKTLMVYNDEVARMVQERIVADLR
jgi:hypothetical protein